MAVDPDVRRKQVRDSLRRLRAKDPEAARQYQRNWREDNPDYMTEWARNNTDRRAGHQRKHKYGITEQEYQDLLVQQDGRCAICKELPDKRRLAVDHNHDTGKVRGLLHTKCNAALGVFKDDRQLLVNAVEYLDLYTTDKENTSE